MTIIPGDKDKVNRTFTLRNVREKIFILHNGCTRRAIDASRLIRYFKLNNCDVVINPKRANYILFITCAFNEIKEKECFTLIDLLSNFNGKLIIAGCLPAITPSRFKKEFNGQFLITKDFDKIGKFFKYFKIKFSDTPDEHRYHFSPILAKYLVKNKLCNYYRGEYLLRDKRYEINLFASWLKRLIRNRTRSSTIRISYGCMGNCAYCGIRNAIGKLRSKPIDVCLKEYRDLLEKGYGEFEIIADDLGAYGLDINSSLADLFEGMSGVDKDLDARWYLMDLRPKWAIIYKDELLRRIIEGKVTKILCPIQSGSDRILKLMNRYDNSEDIAVTLLEFKKANPDLKLETYVIVGFPSETDEDFLATINMVKKIHFDELQLLAYSDRERADSTGFDNKIDEVIIRKRLRIAADTFKKAGIMCKCDGI